MEFTYRAKTDNGQSVEGLKEATDRFSLARELRKEGITVISAVPKQEKGRWSLSWFNNLFNSVSLKDKILFANNLSAMITAGLSLSRSINVIERQTKAGYFRVVLTQIGKKIQHGDLLSVALKSYPKIFPEVFVAMVSAGEESGNLPDSLKVVSEQMKKSYDLRRKIRGAMIYPSIIVGVIIIIGILMMIYLVPTLTSTFKDLGVDLPLSTRIVIFISEFISNNIILNIVGLLAFVTAVTSFIKTNRGRQTWHTFVLHVPVVSLLIKQINSAVIMRTVSALINSGVSMVDSLRITERIIQNIHYKRVMVEAIEKVQKGISLSVVIKSKPHLFPVLVGEMAEVGEETGDLPKMLLNGAVFFEEEVDQATKNLSIIIEPVLMVFIGIAVGFFAISMIGPMYSLSSAI